jgi:hypothetical protein
MVADKSLMQGFKLSRTPHEQHPTVPQPRFDPLLQVVYFCRDLPKK